MPQDETVHLGKEIYHNIFLPEVEGDLNGDYVALDVDTRKWAIASTTRDAIEGFREQCPGAVNTLCELVEYRALHRLRVGSLRRVK